MPEQTAAWEAARRRRGDQAALLFAVILTAAMFASQLFHLARSVGTTSFTSGRVVEVATIAVEAVIFFVAIGGWLFFRLFNLLSPVPIPPNVCTVRLMTRRYVRALVSHRERQTTIAGLWALTGFHQVAVGIQKGRRGTSSYSAMRRMAVLFNARTSFSDRPRIAVFVVGLGVFVVASTAAGYLVVRRLFFGVTSG